MTSSATSMSTKDSIWQTAWRLVKQVLTAVIRRYRKLNIWGKIFIWCFVLFEFSLLAFVVIVTPSRIAQFMYDVAQKVSNFPFGWLIFGAVISLVSFPPLSGHTTLTTLCGFTYGMKGFAIAAAASSIGSALAFVILRILFSKRLHRWSRNNDKWQALETIIREKGLGLIVLVRISPLPPWVYANALFASIQAVALWQFIIATFFVYPKLALCVFIGSRAAALSDGDQRKDMDTQTKVINGILIASSILLGILSSGVVYHLMKRQLKNNAEVSPITEELAEEAIDEVDEGAPLLRDFSSEPVEDTSTNGRL